jgi:hypothetical protein
MKTYILKTVILYVIAINSLFAQKTENNDNISDVVILKSQPIKLGQENIITLKPTTNKDYIDSKYRRRFEYILHNKTNHSNNNYETYYPDTLKINKLYQKDIMTNKDVVKYLSVLYEGLKNNAQIKKESFTQETLMKVASKFFLVTGFLSKESLDWRVCIGINGQKDLFWDEDFTILEAFCFEAIFENLKNEDKDGNSFMNKFLNYIKVIEKEHLSIVEEKDIIKFRSKIFDKMESDDILKKTLLDYYNKNIDNLPFTIE